MYVYTLNVSGVRVHTKISNTLQHIQSTPSLSKSKGPVFSFEIFIKGAISVQYRL